MMYYLLLYCVILSYIILYYHIILLHYVRGGRGGDLRDGGAPPPGAPGLVVVLGQSNEGAGRGKEGRDPTREGQGGAGRGREGIQGSFYYTTTTTTTTTNHDYSTLIILYTLLSYGCPHQESRGWGMSARVRRHISFHNMIDIKLMINMIMIMLIRCNDDDHTNITSYYFL